MNRFIIYEYMSRIKKEDIVRFGISQGVKLEEYEVDVIYKYIKNDYKRILSNPDKVLDEAKYQVSDLTYQKLMELYNKYKDKISQF